MGVDPRVSGFLGRVLDPSDGPVGTCFQVAPGVVVTACHVLNSVDAAEQDATVRVDPLQGGGTVTEATVVRVDPLPDLAVITVAEPLPACVAGLDRSDEVENSTIVAITGVAHVDDSRHSYRNIDAKGVWAGGTTRNDGVRLGRVRTPDLMLGMSGAPVLAGSQVVGVVSGRYNSLDGWLRDSVWVARTEDLRPLLDGLTEVSMARRSPVGGRASASAALIHYHRPDGDYVGWRLHVWGGGMVPEMYNRKWDDPCQPDGRDVFGLYWRVPLIDPTRELWFIVHKGDLKDPGPDQKFFPAEHSDAYVRSGDPTVHRHSSRRFASDRRGDGRVDR